MSKLDSIVIGLQHKCYYYVIFDDNFSLCTNEVKPVELIGRLNKSSNGYWFFDIIGSDGIFNEEYGIIGIDPERINLRCE